MPVINPLTIPSKGALKRNTLGVRDIITNRFIFLDRAVKVSHLQLMKVIMVNEVLKLDSFVV